MEIDITTRIEQLLTEFGLAPSAFADGIQIPRAVMSHILSRRNKPSLEVVQKILKKFPQVNSDWLLNGIGNMIQLNIFEDIENQPTPPNQHIAATPVHNNSIIAQVAAQPLSPIVEPVENIVQAKTQQAAEITTKAKEENIPSEEQSLNLKNTAMPDFSKKIEKIVFFYSDKTFSVHLPE